MGLYKLRPRPDWSLLGVKFKISDEHPRPFYMGVPPPGVTVLVVKSEPKELLALHVHSLEQVLAQFLLHCGGSMTRLRCTS